MRSRSRWIFVVAVIVAVAAALACFRSTSTAEIARLRDHVAMLEMDLKRLAEGTSFVAIPRPEDVQAGRAQVARMVAEKSTSDRGALDERSAANARQAREVLDEMLSRAGVESGSVRVEDLRPPPVAVARVSQRLVDAFNASPLTSKASLIYSGCAGSSCAMEVIFNDARGALEQEAQLIRWLTDADSSCGFTLDPTPMTSGEATSTTRRVAINCG